MHKRDSCSVGAPVSVVDKLGYERAPFCKSPRRIPFNFPIEPITTGVGDVSGGVIETLSVRVLEYCWFNFYLD